MQANRPFCCVFIVFPTNKKSVTVSKMWAKIFTRKFSKNTCRRSIHQKIKPLKPEDFDDIFGGPPRCVFSRHSSVDPSDDNMFHSPVRHSVDKNFRKLPEFKIFSSISNSGMPRKMAVPCGEEFDEVRRSKLDTTSVLNSESEFSPPTSEDDDYSKLRPSIPAWNPSTVLVHGIQQGHQDIPAFSYSTSFDGKYFTENKQQTQNFSGTISRTSSPESMNRGDYSYSSVKISVGDEDSSTNKFHKDDDDDDENDDNDNDMSRFNVFEFSYGYRQGTDEGVGVDEAIAWAKESYQSHSSSAEMTADMPDEHVNESESLHLQREYPNKIKTENVQREVDESREMKMLEEGIKLWSCGKERNIELLLCTLEDILWPNSGWCPIAPVHLYECSNVKKAYQRARLRLHPDKLQQRGATLSEKYIAERIFLILQEAWDAYISQDIIISSRG